MGVWNQRRIHIIDSHTGGEPTRVVIAGWPDPGRGTLAERLAHIRSDHDDFRSAVVDEPRGSDHLVGAILTEPDDPACAAGVIFFNNVGYLGMCVHGTIGLVVTLSWLGRIDPGLHRIETPVGVVTTELHRDGTVTVQNVPSYRLHAEVELEVEGHGTLTGDVAWGGNWFFLTEDHGLDLDAADTAELTAFAARVRRALEDQGVTGVDGAIIDHVELFGPPAAGGDSRNFVLCPGLAYDRSPCGTGTSAKLACLAADRKLAPGATWTQEGIVGSRFTGRYEEHPEGIVPFITGSAFINSEATLLIDGDDPYAMGIRP